MSKTRITLIITCATLLLFAFSGCKLTTDGEPTSLSFVATAENTSRSISRITSGTPTPEVTFTKAEIGLERIELKLLGDESETDTENETMFDGPYTIDLLADISEQEINEVVITAGTYTKIEMELSPQLTGGKTIIIEGTYDNDSSTTGDAVTFSYKTTMTEDFKIENASGIVISESGASVLVSFDLDTWITSAILAAATPETDGSIIIDKDQSKNNDQADDIELNIEAAGELGLDENNDGEID